MGNRHGNLWCTVWDICPFRQEDLLVSQFLQQTLIGFLLDNSDVKYYIATPSTGIHVSPTKHHPVTTGGGGIRRGGVNDNYQFPGEL